MEFNTNILIIMILGIISTVLLHLAKAMERQGIEIFDQIRSKVKGTPSEVEGGAKKPIIYMVGLVLNNITPIWAIIANFFGPSSYLTSMFGLGLIALMIYASKVLHESIQKIEYYGAGVLVVGTLILGFDALNRPIVDPATVNVARSFLFIGIFLVLGCIGVVLALKTKKPLVIGIVFGLLAGGCGGLDPFLKNIGQNYGGAGGIPNSWPGWIIFGLSFGVGTCAFLLTQWGFARKANASVLVPCYNSLYVVIPILVQAWAYPNFPIYPITWIGMAFVIVGIVLMRAFKKDTGHEHGHHNPTEKEIPSG
jgi:hypothetical protein